MDGTYKNVPLEDALKEGDNVRVSVNQIFQRNTDTRSGNVIVRDSTNSRIWIGILPDGTYGIAVSKPGYNVEDAFS